MFQHAHPALSFALEDSVVKCLFPLFSMVLLRLPIFHNIYI